MRDVPLVGVDGAGPHRLPRERLAEVYPRLGGGRGHRHQAQREPEDCEKGAQEPGGLVRHVVSSVRPSPLSRCHREQG